MRCIFIRSNNYDKVKIHQCLTKCQIIKDTTRHFLSPNLFDFLINETMRGIGYTREIMCFILLVADTKHNLQKILYQCNRSCRNFQREVSASKTIGKEQVRCKC